MTPDELLAAGYLEVGYIAKAHGLKGDLNVKLTSDRTERLDVGSELTTESGTLRVARSQPHTDRWIVTFEGVNWRDQADDLRGTKLYALPVVDDDVLFVHELIGRAVVLADGSVVGTCTAVIDNPAHDLLELDTGGLVPMVFVTDTAGDTITIDPPEGLFDL